MSVPCPALPLSQFVSYQRMNSPLGLMMDESLKGGHARTESHFWTPTPLHSALELKQLLRVMRERWQECAWLGPEKPRAHTSLKGFQATGFVCPGSH